MLWRTFGLIVLMLMALATAKARAQEARGPDCPPDALGTARTVAVDPHVLPRVGRIQYRASLPLADREVALTFDDGPLPPYTNRVLEALAAQCVKATYFIVGRMAQGYPALVKRIRAEGHVVGNHSQNHPLAFERMAPAAVRREIEQGFGSIATALGDPAQVAPFFRIPGLLRERGVEAYLQSRGLVTFSADVVADDWKHISAAEVVRRAIARLEEKGRGVLLLHDIQPATAMALPVLLRELKARGFRIVQAVPAGPAPALPMAAAPPLPGPTPRAAPFGVPPTATAKAAPGAAGPDPVSTGSVVAASDALSRATPDDMTPPNRVLATPTPAETSEPAARPLTSAAKPSRAMPTPGKFLTTDPGGWPPTVSVPVPAAGGVGVSASARSGGTGADGRFR